MLNLANMSVDGITLARNANSVELSGYTNPAANDRQLIRLEFINPLLFYREDINVLLLTQSVFISNMD